MSGSRRSMHEGNVTTSQKCVLKHVLGCVDALGPPPVDDDGVRVPGRVALQELLAKQGYGGGATVSLDINLLSLPSLEGSPVPLEELLGPGGHQFVQEFVNSAVLPKNAAQSKAEASGLRSAYMDTSLRSDPARYGRLLERLRAAGMIEYRRSGKARCGLFAVHKKGGRQRLIVDARLSNCCFTDSKPVSLCSGATLGAIKMEEGEKLYVGQVDIENAFYGMFLPEELVPFF